MIEISDHILDIAENSLRAGASRIDITINEDIAVDKLRLTIADDGAGMDGEELAKVSDPFYSTKVERKRKIGLGLPLLFQMSQITGGYAKIDSQKGLGTTVIAEIGLNHIDRQPLGDIAGAFVAIIISEPAINLTYVHRCGGKVFEIKTSEIKKQIDEKALTDVAVLTAIKGIIVEGLKEIDSRLI